MKYHFEKSIKCLILLLFLLCFVKSEIALELFKIQSFDIKNTETFELVLTDQKFSYYVIEVEGIDKTNNYILSAYPSETKTPRIQLAQSFNGVSQLFLTDKEFQDDKMFIELQCSDYISCNGTIKAEGMDIIPLKEGEPIYYYGIEENIFKFTLKLNKEKKYNVWARGNIISTKIDTEDTNNIIKTNENYNMYIVKDIDGNITFTVNGEKGSYINVGYLGYNKTYFESENEDDEEEFLRYYKPTTDMYVDELTITGFLKRGEIDRVCYTINNRGINETRIFGTGNIFNKIAFISPVLNNGKRASKDDINNELFKNGYISFEIKSKVINEQKICFSFPDEEIYEQYSELNEIIYLFQFTSGKTNENKLNIYEPQIHGKYYMRNTLKGEKVAFMSQNKNSKDEVNLNLIIKSGLPIMTVIECYDYPLCSLSKEGITPKSINRFTSMNYKISTEEKLSPISKVQTLLVVTCKDIEGDTDFDDVCVFGTLINREKNNIQVIEDVFYNQFLHENNENAYSIKIGEERKIEKIYIDIITFIGEIKFIPKFPENIEYSQSRALNKISTSVKISNNPGKIKDLYFEVKGLKKTYYTILVNFVRNNNVEEDSEIKNDLQTGIPFLVTVDKSKIDVYEVANKIVKYHNEKYIDYSPLLINFNSLNCKIDVLQVYVNEVSDLTFESIRKFDYYSQIFMQADEIHYYSHYYDFRINITESEASQFPGKLCKIIASGIEVSQNHTDITRDIIVPDNTLQRIQFGEGFTHISYGYVLIDLENDLLISFNLKHPALYKIIIYYEDIKRKEEEIIVSNNIIYLKKEEWKDICKDQQEACFIQLDITLEKTKDVENPVLEILFKSVDNKSNSVSYLSKGQLRNDYLPGILHQYFYTEIGVGDVGYIDVNFFRNKGKVYARIVEESADIEVGANWREKYVLPANDKYLKLDFSSNKINFNTEGYNCDKGCYLLINVFSDIKPDEDSGLTNFPFSIFVQSYPSNINVKEIPIIYASIDQFIIGNIQATAEDYLYELFQVELTSDAEQVFIDFQSTKCKLYINVGNKRPTTQDAHFIHNPLEKDSIYIISKENILAKNKTENLNQNESYNNSLVGITLTIGIWTNIIDDKKLASYAFVVRLKNGNENDIYKVNSDQKALCKTKKMSVKNRFRCVYAIKYDFYSNKNYFFAYPHLKEQSVSMKIYAKYINQTIYEIGSYDKIREEIPTDKNFDITNFKGTYDFLYFNEGFKKDHYMLISVETDKETMVELMSTLSSFNKASSPKLNTEQLFIVPTKNELILQFPSSQMEIVNIQSIGGEAELHWEFNENDKYYLKGKNDKLAMTSDKIGVNHNHNHNLIISAKSNLNENIGFIFSMNYDTRGDKRYFDELIFDNSVRYAYLDNDLPIYYYAQLNHKLEANDYYEIFFTFETLENIESKSLTFYQDIPFECNAFIIKESTLFEMKKNQELNPEKQKSISGIYDTSLRAGLIRVSQKNIEESGIKTTEKPYIFLKIEKRDFFKNIRVYKKINMEITALRNNPKMTITESSYKFGSLLSNEKERKYRLRNDKTFDQINIQFSCLEDALEIEIEGTHKKLKEIDKKYGKKLYSLETSQDKDFVTLIIKRKEPSSNNVERFMFKYSNSHDNEKIYSIKNTEINVERKLETQKQNKTNYTIAINPIENANNADISYILKICDIRPSSNIPTKPFIVPQAQKEVVKEFYNPKIENNNITLPIYNTVSNGSYIQVIAQIKNKESIDYLSYDIFDMSKLDRGGDNPSKGDGDGSNKTLIIVLIALGVLIILIVTVVIIVKKVYKKGSTDLLDQIENSAFDENTDSNENNKNLLGN